jgi:hypothetical protein
VGTVIVERELNEITWYIVSVRFPTPRMAKERWERINAKASKRKGDMGFYRHGPSTDPGRYLTAVTHSRPDALWISRELRGCEPNGLPDDEVLAMILRRIDVVANARLAGRTEGRLSIRRPEVGAVLDPDGTMHEPVVGHG